MASAAEAPRRDRGKDRSRALLRELRVGQLLALGAAVPLVMVLVAVGVGLATVAHQQAIRTQLLGRVEPANGAALQLETALVDQETGIRGYELTGARSFLDPFTNGLSQERRQVALLRRYHVPGTAPALALVLTRIAAWQQETALSAVRVAAERFRASKAAVDLVLAAKGRFAAIRSALAALQARLGAQVVHVSRQLDASARGTSVTLAVIAGVLLATVLAAGLVLSRLVSRPLAQLTRDSRRVAAGELGHRLAVSGPRDMEQLARDVDAMRTRLLDELQAAMAARNQQALTATELKRSNAELEQFAYVASHDLQEPLRKVTSFCQLLQKRYGGQLDERADQYIEFAVDGALRMQQLVNDLLAFSRVGRDDAGRRRVGLGPLARTAVGDLQSAIEGTGARVTIDPLPELVVEAALIRTVFQNLIANAVKFRGDAPPRIQIGASRVAEREWRLHCVDNGIGIEPEYAERIFVIFQRLHPRDRYPGTGIGLAMCRKIIEYHDGRIWLDTSYQGGARICFTLPDPGSTESETIPA